ncbi:acetyltransferase (GNAT) family protein [Breznakibacter xylanolyticus]|uniref:Acetyltransferase (GNAT) family protein n=1 Tax=Breznakibacter xylanolyticus TaxID=990 RepID=A0A2W7N199_9BACT|nr:GNAT family N-acetyltransferase [Breznakibacter xylanolyticus]PZX13543.1 acetyltransferase (GNAT) family protein [Breznakibacter xylanolyticus]
MRTEYHVEKVSAEVYNNDLFDFQYSLFCTPEWVGAMADKETQPVFFHLSRQDLVYGKMAGLAFNGKGLKGKQFYFYAGPAMRSNSDASLYCNLVKSMVQYAARHRVVKLNIKSYDQQHSFFCSDNGLRRTERCEYVYHFDEDHSLETVHKSFLKNVKKAEKVNATIVEDNSEAALKQLVELLKITYSLRNDKHEGAYVPFPYFRVNEQSLKRLLDSGLGRQYVVSAEGQVHCVNFLLIRDGKIFGLIIGSDQFAYDHGFHQFVKHSLINKFGDSARYYNLASADPGSGLANFRVSMGFKEHQVYGAYSNFLVYPHKILNPIIHATHHLNSFPLVHYMHSFTSSLLAHQEVIEH